MLQTRNLTLIPCDLIHIDAYLQGKQKLANLLNVDVPDSFPVFPESFAYWRDRLEADPNLGGWANWIFIHSQDKKIIGEGGFTGEPDANGNVGIGYAIIPEYRQRCLATEAVKSLVAWAFSHPFVKNIQADTLPDGEASIKILKKLGMVEIGSSPEVIHWQISRKAYVA